MEHASSEATNAATAVDGDDEELEERRCVGGGGGRENTLNQIRAVRILLGVRRNPCVRLRPLRTSTEVGVVLA